MVYSFSRSISISECVSVRFFLVSKGEQRCFCDSGGKCWLKDEIDGGPVRPRENDSEKEEVNIKLKGKQQNHDSNRVNQFFSAAAK
jgi:hypothetical protein